MLRTALALASAVAVAACGSTVPTAQRAVPGQDGLAAPIATDDLGVSAPGGSTGAAAPGQSQGGRSTTAAPGTLGPAATSAPTTATAAPQGGAVRAAVGPAAIPLTGPGWDAKNVYIGIPTSEDLNNAVKALGANFDNGSVRGDVEAVLADINRAGGVLGRRLVAAYNDVSAVDLSSNPSGAAQSMCSYFTQDRPVVAVINGAPQLDAQDTFHRCLEKRQVSLLSLSNADYGDKDYARLGPHLFTVATLSTDVLVPTFVAALHRQRFFTGWDVRLGQAGTAAVKVGLLLPETASGHHTADLMRASLKRLGVTVATDFFYDPAGTGTDAQSEVLRFAAAGVTHVLDLPPIAAELYFFQGAAEGQRYRPRYGFTSFNLPLGTQENPALAPAAQQVGSMGIGWQPFNDTDAARDPGAMPGAKRCLDALRRGGQSFSTAQRRASFVGVLLCDSLYLLRDAMVLGQGFTGPVLLQSVPQAGARLATAGTFGSAMSSTDRGVPGFYVDQVYRRECSCYAYVGSKHPFTRG